MTPQKRPLRRLAVLPVLDELFYRFPMKVTEAHVFRSAFSETSYPVCPRCGRTMEREYMFFCSRCGQQLDWENYGHARITYAGKP